MASIIAMMGGGDEGRIAIQTIEADSPSGSIEIVAAIRDALALRESAQRDSEIVVAGAKSTISQ